MKTNKKLNYSNFQSLFIRHAFHTKKIAGLAQASTLHYQNTSSMFNKIQNFVSLNYALFLFIRIKFIRILILKFADI